MLVTSAMVYGAHPDNPVPLAEDAPLAADPDGSVVGDFMEIEQSAERSLRAYPGMEITVVRPAALVGHGIDTLVTRHFEAPRLLAMKGCAPRWQFCHIDDLVSAIELAAAGEVAGALAVGCDGWLEQEQVEELSGLRRIELPAGVTFATAQRLHRAGITPAPVTAQEAPRDLVAESSVAIREHHPLNRLEDGSHRPFFFRMIEGFDLRAQGKAIMELPELWVRVI